MQISGRDFTHAMTLPVWQSVAAVRWLEGRVSNLGKPNQQTAAKAALTFGDCVSQEILLTALRAAFPSVVVEAEEDTPGVRAFEGNVSMYTACIDPIDGTLRYLRGDGLYAVIVGLEREGRAEAAVVAIPQEGCVIRGVRGEGAEVAREGEPFRPVRLEPGGTRVLLSAGVDAGMAERLRARGFATSLAAGGAIGLAPLLDGTFGAVRISEPQGLSKRAWLASLPLLEAGGVVETLEGPFPEKFEPGVPGMLVAATAGEIGQLRAALDAGEQ